MSWCYLQQQTYEKIGLVKNTKIKTLFKEGKLLRGKKRREGGTEEKLISWNNVNKTKG